MSELSWNDVVEMPGELDDETVEALPEDATGVQDMTGEVCPYPQVEAKKDHVPSTENAPKAVGDDATAKVWQSGDGRYQISLSKE
jgi:hypothetical protein